MHVAEFPSLTGANSLVISIPFQSKVAIKPEFSTISEKKFTILIKYTNRNVLNY